MPSPKKRSGSISLQPPRRSRRLADLDEGTSQKSTLSALSSNLDAGEVWSEIYQNAKDRATNYTPAKRSNDGKLTSLLLALLEWLPQEGKESVAKDINEAKTDDALWEVFQNLVTGLLRPMKARTSTNNSITPSPHSHRRSNSEIVASTLTEAQSRDDRFRQNCLRRDGDRCVISKSMSVDAWTELGRPADVRSTFVEAAHIIPFSYASWDKSSAAPTGIADTWEVLFRCFPAVRRTGLQAETINELYNGLTLERNLHLVFGDFRIAFVATVETPHQYKVKAYPSCPTDILQQLPKDMLVQFEKAKGAERLPLPDPACLDCHYRLAEILNASAMGDYIDKKLKDWRDLKGSTGPGHLSANGSTEITELLQVAFWESVAG
ncbi:hypothetical protein BDW59DRAFT_161677 [Aspergillus cavernicola]|uniref:HNH nuclease domain-containing protein n=1 Tax=Aspergillus cavernicola TaxID=176166 RepID=A0ABR4ICI3_9EURO